MPRSPHRSALIFAGLATLSASGCSGGRSADDNLPIAGMVTLEGKPAGLTLINFWPAREEEQAGDGRTTSDHSGKFALGMRGNENQKGVGLAPGEYKVTLSRTVDGSGRPVIEGGKPSEPVTATETFPAIYTKKASTPLMIKVSPESTEFRFDVKKS